MWNSKVKVLRPRARTISVFAATAADAAVAAFRFYSYYKGFPKHFPFLLAYQDILLGSRLLLERTIFVP